MISESQARCRLFLAVFCILECIAYQVYLKMAQSITIGKFSRRLLSDRRCGLLRIRLTGLLGRMKRIESDVDNLLGIGAIDRPFGDIFQLPDIPGPGVVHQRFDGMFTELRYFFAAQLEGHTGCKMVCQSGGIWLAGQPVQFGYFI